MNLQYRLHYKAKLGHSTEIYRAMYNHVKIRGQSISFLIAVVSSIKFIDL